jgi:hypothetical protein
VGRILAKRLLRRGDGWIDLGEFCDENGPGDGDGCVGESTEGIGGLKIEKFGGRGLVRFIAEGCRRITGFRGAVSLERLTTLGREAVGGVISLPNSAIFSMFDSEGVRTGMFSSEAAENLLGESDARRPESTTFGGVRGCCEGRPSGTGGREGGSSHAEGLVMRAGPGGVGGGVGGER